MKKILCCLVVVCGQLALAQIVPGPSVPPDAAEAARRLRALNAISSATVQAVGVDDQDCMQKASLRAEQQALNILADCNRQADGLTTCSIVDHRVIQYPTYVSAIGSSNKYDEIHSDENTCRSTSIARAESQALAACESSLGVVCDIVSRGVVSDHHTYQQRRYLLFGPKDEHQVCAASAAAAPISIYTRQCSIEITARSRPF